MTNDSKNTSKNILKFYCEKCDFKCFKTGDWKRHIVTRKHVNDDVELHKNITVEHYTCECGKIYKYRQGLHTHKIKCTKNCNKISDGLILEILKENKELKGLLIEQNKTNQQQNKALFELTAEQNKAIIELMKNGQTVNNTVNAPINSHNKTFNLQFFLNETCKDAMNIKDFVDSIKIELSDFENVGDVGFVNGITKLIVKKLKCLKQEKRPVHCTDEKRKIIYVKDQNKWEKEDDTHKKVRNAIKHIANTNFILMKEFKNKYPDCINSGSKYNNRYLQLMMEVLGGSGNSDEDNETKIITNISKEILIEK